MAVAVDCCGPVVRIGLPIPTRDRPIVRILPILERAGIGRCHSATVGASSRILRSDLAVAVGCYGLIVRIGPAVGACDCFVVCVYAVLKRTSICDVGSVWSRVSGGLLGTDRSRQTNCKTEGEKCFRCEMVHESAPLQIDLH
jgi:hypothetical protein